MPMPPDLNKRLRFFGINKTTKREIGGFMPVLLPKIDGLADKFYGYTRNFSEARHILAPHYENNRLKDKQIKHWIRLFLCKFDEEYLAYGLKIGRIHFKHKVNPYLYIGSYNYIQCEFIELASKHYSDAKIQRGVLTAINRLIALDMDIALSAYTREYWLHNKVPIKKPDPSPANAVGGSAETALIC